MWGSVAGENDGNSTAPVVPRPTISWEPARISLSVWHQQRWKPWIVITFAARKIIQFYNRCQEPQDLILLFFEGFSQGSKFTGAFLIWCLLKISARFRWYHPEEPNCVLSIKSTKSSEKEAWVTVKDVDGVQFSKCPRKCRVTAGVCGGLESPQRALWSHC